MTEQHIEPINNIINHLPAPAKTMILKLSANNDPEILCTWLLTWVAKQLKLSKVYVESIFLPAEINLVKKMIKDNGFTPANPPTAAFFTENLTDGQPLLDKIALLNDEQILYLTLEMYMDELADDILNTRKYISAREFGLAIQPNRSKERIAVLCKEGRIPGAFKSPDNGQWYIPADSVAPVETELNKRREEFYRS